MPISLIAAMTKQGVIGNNNTLPWNIPEELKYFREMTSGKPVIMGRKTFESIGSKPLPKRQNIILTRENLTLEGCIVVHSSKEAIKAAGDVNEIMVIGGAVIFQEFLPLASRLYLNIIHQDYPGDTFFPNVHWEEWILTFEEAREGFTIKIWDRKNK